MFTVDIVSPFERVYRTERAVRVTLPGAEGEFAVHQGHEFLATTLRPGKVRVLEAESRRYRIFHIEGGSVIVARDAVSVMLDHGYRGAADPPWTAEPA